MNTTHIAKLDFETASAVDIKEVGAWEYAAHASTSVLCYALKLDNLSTCGFKTNKKPDFEFLKHLAQNPNVIFSSYNAFFERMIWRHVLTKKYNIPEIPVNRWRCSSARSLIMATPKGLNKTASFLECGEQKHAAGLSLMLKLCKQWEHPENIPERDMDILLNYCKKDVDLEDLICSKTVDITPAEQAVWEQDQLINERGILLDKKLLNNMRLIANDFILEVNQKMHQLTNGRVSKATEIQKIKKYLQETYSFQTNSLDKANILAILNDLSVPQEVKEILKLRASGAKSSIAKLMIMQQMSQSDDYARGCLIYHGASTGRWTSEKIQFHNLPAKSMKNKEDAINIIINNPDNFIPVYEADTAKNLSSLLRAIIIPPTGKKLLVADFASIEARLVVAIAESLLGIQRFKNYDLKIDVDPYVLMARDIYNYMVNKDDKDERDLGKAAVLGCGFGMGIAKFEATCEARGIVLADGLAAKAVRAYRTTLPEVPQLWTGLEKAAKSAILSSFGVFKGITYRRENSQWLSCELPSGRKLWYYQPKIEKVQGAYGLKDVITYATFDPSGAKIRQTIWGGTLTENVVQATARDIMVKAMQNLEATGRYKICLTVHDEVVTYAEQSASAQEMHDLMCKKPIWAASYPIEVETKELTRYGK